MTHVRRQTALVVGRQPIHAMLAQFPIVCFTLTLFTDIAYWRTSYLMWHDFSSWLLFAGLVFGALAVVAGIIDFLFVSRARSPAASWLHAIGGLVVLALALVNSLVHAGDGWTAVVPWGLALSALTVVVMVVIAWLGRSFVDDHRIGVSDHG